MFTNIYEAKLLHLVTSFLSTPPPWVVAPIIMTLPPICMLLNLHFPFDSD